jgi:hypothetical protein
MKLKSGSAGPDTPRMIEPAAGPPATTAQGVHALYVSMNSPVVTVDHLPVGPAAAAIAVHGAGTTLLVRSVRTGTVAFFAAAPRFGLEAALSHAEALGFLFDDEANLAGEGRTRADWPVWIAEVFTVEPGEQGESDLGDPSEWLSKFRWRRRAPVQGREHSHP